MKRFGLSLALAWATLFLASPFVALSAEPVRTASDSNMDTPAAPAGMAKDILAQFDRNGDGRIDDGERAEARERMLKEQVDRQLARTAAARATPTEIQQRALEFFDRNDDGRLDENERRAAMAFVELRADGAIPARRAVWREELLRRVDANANRRVDPEEREALVGLLFGSEDSTPQPSALETLIRSTIETNPDQRSPFDLDGNGRLDDQEWAAARQSIARAFSTAPDVAPRPANSQSTEPAMQP